MKPFDHESQAVVMCGISGSGKTHFAKMLERKGYTRLSVDALIWQKAGSRLPSLSDQERRLLFTECNDEMRAQLVDLLKAGRKVVVDATHCKRSIRDRIRNLCASVQVKPIFVYCEASEEELLSRLNGRTGAGSDDLPVTPHQLADYYIGFERPQPDETDICTCPNHIAER